MKGPGARARDLAPLVVVWARSRALVCGQLEYWRSVQPNNHMRSYWDMLYKNVTKQDEVEQYLDAWQHMMFHSAGHDLYCTLRSHCPGVPTAVKKATLDR
eukprot:2457417-Rhodomonas_salina.1